MVDPAEVGLDVEQLVVHEQRILRFGLAPKEQQAQRGAVTMTSFGQSISELGSVPKNVSDAIAPLFDR